MLFLGCLLGWAGLTSLTGSLKSKWVHGDMPMWGENNPNEKDSEKTFFFLSLCVEDMILV